MKLFYFLLSTIFLSINVYAQSNANALSPEQKQKLRVLGVQAIQEVIFESDIDLSDSEDIQRFVSEILQTQISEETTPDAISDITNIITSSIVAIAASDTAIDLPTVVEATASEATKTTINTIANLNSDINGDGVVDERDIQEMANAAASGASAGALSASSQTNLDISEIVEAASSGSSSGTVEAAVEGNLNVADMVEATSSGSTSGIVGTAASIANDINGDGVVDEKDFATFIDASSKGSVSGAIESVNSAGDINNDGIVNELDVLSVLEATASGVSGGAVQSSIEMASDINFDGVVDEQDIIAISETVATSVTNNIINEAVSDGYLAVSIDAQSALESSVNAVSESILEAIIDNSDTTIEELSEIVTSISDAQASTAEANGLDADAIGNIVAENVELNIVDKADETADDGDELPIVETAPDDTTLVDDPSNYLLENNQ